VFSPSVFSPSVFSPSVFSPSVFSSTEIAQAFSTAQTRSIIGISATATSTWGGQTITGGDTLVMYTYGGDANLDGKINVDDYGRIDLNIPLGTGGWFNGDFNYDGKVNVDDYGIIDFNVGIQGAPFFAGDGADVALTDAVPEPAGPATFFVAAGGLRALFRRRRGSQASPV